MLLWKHFFPCSGQKEPKPALPFLSYLKLATKLPASQTEVSCAMYWMNQCCYALTFQEHTEELHGHVKMQRLIRSILSKGTCHKLNTDTEERETNEAQLKITENGFQLETSSLIPNNSNSANRLSCTLICSALN